MRFTSSKPHYEYLRKKWLLRHRNIQNKFWDKHQDALRHFTVGSLGSLMLLSTPLLYQPAAVSSANTDALKGYDQNALLAQALSGKVPPSVRPLNHAEEEGISQILSDKFGFTVAAQIDNIRLNRSYGLIGGEQHLYRYPTDNLYAHMDNAADYIRYGSAGMASHLGAWGYFAASKAEFTEEDKQKERYYLAVQTFLAPGFAENADKYRDFFKYRKMLVVNPDNGRTVVAVIADAGPAEWTGKHLGGSPEVIDALGLATGARKGSVLFFFIQNSKVALGSIKIKP